MRGVDDRYRQGRRRTDAQPLRASWRPQPEEQAPERVSHAARKAPRGGLKGKLATITGAYGWRTYALPVLLVLTVLVVFDSAGGTEEPTRAAGNSAVTASAPGQEARGGPAAPLQAPVATENAPRPVDLKIPTAELPDGGEFTRRGKGTWHVVPGTTKKVGTGDRVYTYTVEVEDGVDPASYGGDDAFAAMVDATLADPRGWIGGGSIAFQRVAPGKNPDFRLSLTSPETDHRPDVCGYTIRYEASCFRRSMGRVVINLARWVRGAHAFNADLGSYRQYALNHEVGHVLGNGHVGCGKTGALAPVMMQQSFGVSNNYVAKLNKADPGNYGAVPSDGKVCKPNPWPNPDARPPR